MVSEDIMLTQRLNALKVYILYDSIYLEISKRQNNGDGKQSGGFQEMQVGQASTIKGQQEEKRDNMKKKVFIFYREYFKEG